MSEGGLFNGVLSIHGEFECRLLVCLHDGLAARFLVVMQENEGQIKKEKAGEGETAAVRAPKKKKEGVLELFKIADFSW